MQQLTEARVEWLMADGVAEATERITSAANLWADLLSRGRVAVLGGVAPTAVVYGGGVLPSMDRRAIVAFLA